MEFFNTADDFLQGFAKASDTASDIVSGFDTWGQQQPTSQTNDTVTQAHKVQTTQAQQAPKATETTISNNKLILVGGGLLVAVLLFKVV